MKMLMILSRDRSSHTTICVHVEREETEGRKGGDRVQIQSQCDSDEVGNIQ